MKELDKILEKLKKFSNGLTKFLIRPMSKEEEFSLNLVGLSYALGIITGLALATLILAIITP